MSTASIIGLVVVPLTIFVLGAAGAAIAGAIRFAKYMVRSEESLKTTAQSAQQIAARLERFIDETDDRLEAHGMDIAVLKWELDGRRGVRPDALRP